MCNNILLKRKITLDGSINPHKWTTFSQRETANVMPKGHYRINKVEYKNWTYALIRSLHCVWMVAHMSNLRGFLRQNHHRYSFLLCYSHIRIQMKIFFYFCSTFLLHFVTKLESQLSMFSSIPTLPHIFSCPYGGVGYNLKNGISIRVHSYYSCGKHFTEKDSTLHCVPVCYCHRRCSKHYVYAASKVIF